MSDNRVCKIYLLKNKVNGKIYVGQTWLLLHERMRNGDNYKNSVHLYNAIQKHGVANFEYEVLAECHDQASADKLEAEYIIKYDSRNPEIGYNIKEGGSAGKHSEETKEKIAETMRNKEWSPEALENRAKAGHMWKGKIRGPHTEEWKEDVSNKMSEWHANNMHPMQGKTHSEEAKRKIGAASKGRKMNPESVKKRSEARKMDPEREKAIVESYNNQMTIGDIEKKFHTSRGSIYRLLKRNDISNSHSHDSFSGKQHSDETKEKMAKARSEYWENKKS